MKRIIMIGALVLLALWPTTGYASVRYGGSPQPGCSNLDTRVLCEQYGEQYPELAEVWCD